MPTPPRPEADRSKASAANSAPRNGDAVPHPLPAGDAPLSVLETLLPGRSPAEEAKPAPERRPLPQRPRGFVARRIARRTRPASTPAGYPSRAAAEKSAPDPSANSHVPPAFPKSGHGPAMPGEEKVAELPQNGNGPVDPIAKALRIFEKFAKQPDPPISSSEPPAGFPRLENHPSDQRPRDTKSLSGSPPADQVRKHSPWSLNMTRAFKIDPRLPTDESVEEKLQAMAKILDDVDTGNQETAKVGGVPTTDELRDATGLSPRHQMWKPGSPTKHEDDLAARPDDPFASPPDESSRLDISSDIMERWEMTELPASVRRPLRIAPISPPDSSEILQRPSLSFASLEGTAARHSVSPPPIGRAPGPEKATLGRPHSRAPGRVTEDDRGPRAFSTEEPKSDRGSTGWVTVLLGLVCVVLLAFYLNDIVQFIARQEPLIERSSSSEEPADLEEASFPSADLTDAPLFGTTGDSALMNHEDRQASETTVVHSEDPREVINAFHRAQGIESKKPFITESGPALESAMASFYRHAEEFTGPVTRVSVVNEGSFADSGREFVSVQVEIQDRASSFEIPLVKDGENGLRFSWHAYVQFKERLFQKYSEGLWHDWSHFFVEIRRVTGEEHPEDSVGREWYRLSSPEAPGYAALAHVAHDGPAEADLRRRIGDDRSYEVQVDLRQDIEGGLEILKLRRTSWDPTPVEQDGLGPILSRSEEDEIPGLWE